MWGVGLGGCSGRWLEGSILCLLEWQATFSFHIPIIHLPPKYERYIETIFFFKLILLVTNGRLNTSIYLSSPPTSSYNEVKESENSKLMKKNLKKKKQ